MFKLQNCCAPHENPGVDAVGMHAQFCLAADLQVAIDDTTVPWQVDASQAGGEESQVMADEVGRAEVVVAEVGLELVADVDLELVVKSEVEVEDGPVVTGTITEDG